MGLEKTFVYYIDNGGVGIEQIIQPGIEEMITALESKGYKKGVDYIFMLDKKLFILSQHGQKDYQTQSNLYTE
jgi:hypothetical protein